MTKSNFTVLRAGNLYGRMRKVGETIELTDREAKYPFLNGMIGLTEQPAPEPAPEPDPVPAKAPKRKPKKAATAKSGK